MNNLVKKLIGEYKIRSEDLDDSSSSESNDDSKNNFACSENSDVRRNKIKRVSGLKVKPGAMVTNLHSYPHTDLQYKYVSSNI